MVHLAKSFKSYWNCCHYMHIHASPSQHHPALGFVSLLDVVSNHCRHNSVEKMQTSSFHLLSNSLDEHEKN